MRQSFHGVGEFGFLTLIQSREGPAPVTAFRSQALKYRGAGGSEKVWPNLALFKRR